LLKRFHDDLSTLLASRSVVQESSNVEKITNISNVTVVPYGKCISSTDSNNLSFVVINTDF